MTVWFISRHPGAKAWALAHNLHVDRWADHLDPAEIEAGDIVLGTLPLHIAEKICSLGARFFALTLDIPFEMRGRELSLDSVQRYHGHLEEFIVRRRQTNFAQLQINKPQQTKKGGH